MRRRGAVGAVLRTLGVNNLEDGVARHDAIALTPSQLNQVILDALATPTAMETTSMAEAMSFATPQEAPSDRFRWTVADSHEGQITTDWVPIAGRTAGLLWWKKTYATQVRHMITITRAYKQEELTTFTITTEVRERPNPLYPWSPADPDLGQASFENLKDQLVDAVRRAERDVARTAK